MAALRFPSLSHLADRAGAVARRFPWTIVAALAAAGFAIASTYGHDRPQDALVRAAFVAVLGLPATIALALLAEVRRRGETARLLWPAVGLALLVVFYLTWPGPEAKHDMIRYLQLAAVLHLAVAVLPFLGTEESVGFWQYNRFLFVGFLRAVVFSAVLFIGAAVALGAVDKLFGVHVPGEAYARIWFFMAFVVNTWIFLAAVPDDISALVYETNYPRPLKVFAQYVLTPLAFTYLIILLAYLVKLVTGAEWPSGWVGWLVTSVAVTGLLGFLLVHPLRGEPGEGWIRIYARWLFVGLTPAAIMLLVAFAKTDRAVRTHRTPRPRHRARALAARHCPALHPPARHRDQDRAAQPGGDSAAHALWPDQSDQHLDPEPGAPAARCDRGRDQRRRPRARCGRPAGVSPPAPGGSCDRRRDGPATPPHRLGLGDQLRVPRLDPDQHHGRVRPRGPGRLSAATTNSAASARRPTASAPPSWRDSPGWFGCRTTIRRRWPPAISRSAPRSTGPAAWHVCMPAATRSPSI